jgi:uncharacterized protein
LIALDTNILVYAHRRDSEFNERAYARIAELARGRGAWAIPWPCIYEFFAVVTHPRIYDPPSSTDQALEQIDVWLEAPGVVLLTETEVHHWEELRGVIASARIAGPRVHDARIAALCLAHGVRELWTADRDFSRFPALPTHNPLAA